MSCSQFSTIEDWIGRKLKHHMVLSLFAMTLSLSIVLGTIHPLQAQTASPSPQLDCAVPPALCADIKQLAQEDVADDIARRTGHAIELFKEKHPDWKTDPSKAKREVGRTYDREYSQQEKVEKQDLKAAWERWTENGLLVPFLGVLVLAVAAWFRDAIGKAWDALVKAIDNWIYSRFAGTPLFERVALQRYREALVENYQHLKIPFRVNHHPLDMSEIYVPLKVAGSSEGDQVDAYGAIAQHRRLMVTGIPGSGKTMLLRHVALTYGKGRLTGLENRPLPILVELHRLSDPELTEEKLIAAIVEAFKRNRFPNADRFVRHSLENGKLMLLLDGLDEVNSGVRPVLVQRISDLLRSLDEHQRCRLIVTCRTAVYDNEFAHETDQTLEVVEFTDQQMRRFLDAWKQEMPPDKSIDQLMQTLRDRPQIMALARNPLLLTIIAHLYTDPAFELPRSRFEFYEFSTRTLLEQWQDKLNQYRGGDKRRILQYLALHQQQASTEKQTDRRSIDYPEVLKQIKQLLPSLNLDPERDSVPILDELVERSGLFLKIDGGDRYQFAHLTLQEYFAALALADKPNELMQFFRQDPTTWREVVKLWCGIAGDSTALIMEVYQQDEVLGFECLADAQEVEQTQAELIITHFKGLLDQPDEPGEIARAFGAVAASNRPRGKAVFRFLVETLRAHPNVICRTLVANALSLTNLPEAAKELASLYVLFLRTGRHLLEKSEIRQPFVRMGDLAVPYLHQYSLRESVPALNDLLEIGTPDAAEAIVSSIWFEESEDSQVWGTAAIHLATLLVRPEIEDRLRSYKLSDEQRQVRQLEWVWQPFKEPANSALPIITGRIAYLLSQIRISAIPKPPPSMDLRLIVPVCSIEIRDQARLPQKWSELGETITLANGEITSINGELLATVYRPQQEIDSMLGKTQTSSSAWRLLLAGLSANFQLSLVQSLLTATRQPTRDDWRNIFQSVQYEFKTSRQYCGILFIAAFLSLFAIFGIWNISEMLPIGTSTGLMGFTLLVIITFWWALSKGVEEPWEPNLFVRLGVCGLQTYPIELNQLLQNGIVWSGIEVVFKLFRTKQFSNGSFAFAFAFTSGSVVAGESGGAVALVSALAVASAVAVTKSSGIAITRRGALTRVFDSGFGGALTRVFGGALVLAFAGGGALVLALAFASGGAVSFGHFKGAVTGAVGFAIAYDVAFAAYSIGALAGLGLGCWYYLKDEPEKKWRKFFAVLALPWFCTTPTVLSFAWAGLTSLFGYISFLHLPPWISALLLESLLIGVCSWLWWWGQKREALARNPLQSGLIKKTLAKYKPSI
jgi:hypothetical protein